MYLSGQGHQGRGRSSCSASTAMACDDLSMNSGCRPTEGASNSVAPTSAVHRWPGTSQSASPEKPAFLPALTAGSGLAMIESPLAKEGSMKSNQSWYRNRMMAAFVCAAGAIACGRDAAPPPAAAPTGTSVEALEEASLIDQTFL